MGEVREGRVARDRYDERGRGEEELRVSGPSAGERYTSASLLKMRS